MCINVPVSYYTYIKLTPKYDTDNKLKMSNLFVWCVFIIWIQFFTFKCRADQYKMDQRSPLVFIVDTKRPQDWNEIRHYMKSIVNEFGKQQSDDINNEYRFIQNG